MNVVKTEIKNKSRKLSAKWTVTLEHGQTEHNLELEKEIAKTLQEEIDWGILSDMLVEIGWQRVILSPLTLERFSHVHVWLGQVKPWLDSNMTGLYRSRRETWLFENSKDATLFILRWTNV